METSARVENTGAASAGPSKYTIGAAERDIRLPAGLPRSESLQSCHTESVFTLRRPSIDWIQHRLQVAAELVHPIADLGLLAGTDALVAPPGFAIDHRRSQIGSGERDFRAAKAAFRAWEMFNLGWAKVAEPRPPLSVGALVAVEVHSLGLWTVNINRIVHVIDEPRRFGLVYSTTSIHVERGEECFLLERDPTTDVVSYDLSAISQPAHPLARLGYPITRHFQHKFAWDSHKQMQKAIQANQN
jgi:uncharacterized protein (UPF0548 family)